MPTPLRAAIYTRVSSDKTGEELAVKRQEEDCRKVCAKRGWEVIEPLYIDNDITAADRRKTRKGYQRLLKDISSGLVDAVVVYDMDRLHRQPIELEEFVQVCDQAGVMQLATANGTVDMGTGDGMLFARIKGAVAAEEVRKIKERCKRKKLELAVAGKPSGGGSRPFGYEKGGMVIRESEAEEIRKAAEFLLKGGTIYAIRYDWMNRGVRSVTDSRRADGRPNWAPNVVREILIRPRNAGLREHKGKTYKAQWPAILDKKTFTAISALLNDPGRRPRPPSRDYPLRGILTCEACGTKLSSVLRTKQRHYGCRNEGRGCGKVWISADRAEEYALGILLVLAEHPATLAALEKDHGIDAKHLNALVNERAGRKSELLGLEAKFSRDLISEETYVPMRKEFQTVIDGLEHRIALLRLESPLGSLGPGLKESWPEKTADEQRAVLLALVKEIKVAQVGHGGVFDRSRLTFEWRTGALKQAVGFDDDGNLDLARLEHVWRTGALKDVLSGDPDMHAGVVFDSGGALWGVKTFDRTTATGVTTSGTDVTGVVFTLNTTDDEMTASIT